MTDPGPQPLLEALLAALRSGVTPGAAALWAALTPRARGPLGDVAGAERALANELLSPLVAHRQGSAEPWERRDDAARTTVAVSGAPSGAAVYQVSARRQADGAWRLTGLRRDDLPLA